MEKFVMILIAFWFSLTVSDDGAAGRVGQVPASVKSHGRDRRHSIRIAGAETPKTRGNPDEPKIQFRTSLCRVDASMGGVALD